MAVKLLDDRRTTMITESDLLNSCLGEFNFREIGEMLREIHNAKRRSKTRFEGVDLEFRCDDEVVWDYWSVGRDNPSGSYPTWNLTVRYSDFVMNKDQLGSHDYSRMLRRGRSTAYKARPASPEAEYNFWLDAGWIRGDRDRAIEEISDLSRFSRTTSDAEKSADRWLELGFDVKVFCSSLGCNERIIPRSVLDAFISKGKNIDQFRSALVCRKCGRKMPRIEPYEATIMTAN